MKTAAEFMAMTKPVFRQTWYLSNFLEIVRFQHQKGLITYRKIVIKNLLFTDFCMCTTAEMMKLLGLRMRTAYVRMAQVALGFFSTWVYFHYIAGNESRVGVKTPGMIQMSIVLTFNPLRGELFLWTMVIYLNVNHSLKLRWRSQ